MQRPSLRQWISPALLLGLLATGLATPVPLEASPRFPNILVVTVDTLRQDRLSGYGYGRSTSPHFDQLMREGARFTQARCPEPLTAPSMASMLTSLHPHDHGCSRNGLRIRPGLPSMPRIFSRRGFRTAAFVSNWTLKDKLSGLGEHFDEYNEIFTRKRWFGLANSEATGEDVTEAAVDWLEEHAADSGSRPFFLWAHYVEPHAPYRFHRSFADQVGLSEKLDPTPSERYDTEIAFVDQAVGELLAQARRLFPGRQTLIAFAADHGENLGEHGYKGHGRFLWEESLKVPLSITWPGKVRPGAVAELSSLLDLAPTLVGLVGLPVPNAFQGYDWAPVLLGTQPAPKERTTYHQAHRGAVHSPQDRQKVRRRGLLEVGLVRSDGSKEVFRLKNNTHRHHDLDADPREKMNRAPSGASLSDELTRWLQQVQEGLTAADDLPPPSLDAESQEQLRALGYLD